MADVQEIFEDFGDNTKKLFKNKWFVAGAGVVAVAALYVAWRKKAGASGAVASVDESGTMYYTGYPVVSGGTSEDYYGGTDASYYESIIADMDSSYAASLDSIQMENAETLALYAGMVEENQQKLTDTLSALEKERAVSQMRANSELYNALGDSGNAETKAALHAENAAIAEKYGFTFNPDSGNWYEGNSVVYTTAKQNAGEDTTYTGGKAVTSGTYKNNTTYHKELAKAVTYDKNVDYSLAIKEAKASGKSAEYIAGLEASRNAKINDMYGGVDPAKK